jgi:hypothetical protein
MHIVKMANVSELSSRTRSEKGSLDKMFMQKITGFFALDQKTSIINRTSIHIYPDSTQIIENMKAGEVVNMTWNIHSIGYNREQISLKLTTNSGTQRNGSINQFTVNVIPRNFTPKISSKKRVYSMFEDPEFELEYSNHEFLSEIQKRKSKNKLVGLPREYKDIRDSINESLKITLQYNYGPPLNITSELSDISDGKLKIKIPKNRSFRPGTYNLLVEYKLGNETYSAENEFKWGLVSVNTKKSIYKPGEIAELAMVVLDSYGHSVCDAEVELLIVSPEHEIINLSTNNGLINSSECGIYLANYSVQTRGNYTLNVTSYHEENVRFAYPNRIVFRQEKVKNEFSSYFTVKEDYAFDIIRLADIKIDPTIQDYFDVNVTFESYIETDSIMVSEYVPTEFEIFNTDAQIIKSGSEQVLIFNKTLVNNKTSVSYTYSVPHIWPYLYSLGPLTINHNFTEARPWYIAVDPIQSSGNLESGSFVCNNELHGSQCSRIYTWSTPTFDVLLEEDVRVDVNVASSPSGNTITLRVFNYEGANQDQIDSTRNICSGGSCTTGTYWFNLILICSLVIKYS